MSQADVHEIMCPVRDRELEQLRKHRAQAEVIVLSLRRLLIGIDGRFPNEYDGTAWQKYEC